MTEKSESILDKMKIASPCPVSWDTMETTDDERKRYCRQCSLHVYDLSAMSKQEAEQLLLNKSGRLCVNFYQRPDGKVMTDDCPAAFRAIRRRYRKIASFIIGILCTLPWFPALAQSPSQEALRLGGDTCLPEFPPYYFYDNSESGKKSVAKLRSLLRASIPSPDKNLARGNVAVTVNPNGTVRDVTIQTTTGNADIDKKVLDIIKKTRMSPFKPEDGLDRKFLNLKFDDPAINAPKLKKPTKKSPQKKQQ